MAQLSEIRTAINSFSAKDFPLKYFSSLPAPEKIAAFEKAMASGAAWKESNPYGNKCDILSIAMHTHLEAMGIPNAMVGSDTHTYLMVPVATQNGQELYILDPTIRQYFPNSKQSYFLGSKEQLLELKAAQPEHAIADMERWYFKNLTLKDNYAIAFTPDDCPQSAKAMLPTDVLEVLEGKVSQDDYHLRLLTRDLGSDKAARSELSAIKEFRTNVTEEIIAAISERTKRQQSTAIRK